MVFRFDFVVLGFSLAILAFDSVLAQEPIQDEIITDDLKAIAAPTWDTLFDRVEGWTGADGIYSTALSGMDQQGGIGENERTLMTFGDTLVGRVGKDGKRLAGTKFVNSTAAILTGLVPDASKIRFVIARDEDGQPKSLVVPNTSNAGEGQWYWLSDSVVIGDSVHTIAMRMKHRDDGTKGMWNFALDGTTVLTSKAAAPFQEVAQVDAPLFFSKSENRGEMVFGGAITANTKQAQAPNPNGYVYVYGLESQPFQKHLLAARVTASHFLEFDEWRFWDGNDWVAEAKKAVRLTGRLSSEFSITPMAHGRFILVFQMDGMGKDVAVRFADSPIGPWGELKRIYHCPETEIDDKIFAYNAKAHTHLSKPGELLISYNVNTMDFGDLFRHADRYRPRFIRLILPK